MNTIFLDIGRDFSKTPGPRYRKLGPNSGEAFREDVLEPMLKGGDLVVVNIDNTAGYGASFLEEAFGGAVRTFGLAYVKEHLRIDTTKRLFLLRKIDSEMQKAENERGRR